MSAAKVTASVASIGFALIFGGGVYLYMNFNTIAHQLAEKYASQALGVEVSIGLMDVSLQERHITVNNIKIDNPPGYKNAHVATIGKLDITAGRLSRELIEFKNVSVEDADIYLEVKPGSTNMSDIRNNLNRNAGENPSAGEQAVKVILDHMIMNGTIHPSVTIADLNIEAMALPTLELNNIGGANGVSPGEAMAQIWVPLSRQVLRAANQQGYLQGMNEEALKEMGMSRLNEVKDRINEEVDSITNNLKGFLGGE